MARPAARLDRAKVDSPQETFLRLLLHFAGLPEPVVNVDVCDEFGEWLARPDLSYPDQRIALEFNGDTHRTDRRQWQYDTRLASVLHEHGWLVIVLTYDDLHRQPMRTLRRVSRALEMRRHPDLPTELSNGWKSLFGTGRQS